MTEAMASSVTNRSGGQLMRVGELYAEIKRLLAAHTGSSSDARVILCAALGYRDFSRAVIDSDKPADEKASAKALMMAERRSKGEPLQYLLGRWDFGGRSFVVREGVLIPREETLLITSLAAEMLPENGNILELGSGSGAVCITIKLERPDASVSAVEKYDIPFAISRENAAAQGADINFIHGDMFELEFGSELFDVIISNPPYLDGDDMEHLQQEVSFEPKEALFGGKDGLFFYRSIISRFEKNLRHGGCFIFETGSTQTSAVAGMFPRSYVSEINNDCFGLPRAVVGKKPTL